MGREKVEIIITASDQASGPLRGIRGALGGIVSVAGGILGAQLFTNLASGMANMGREALTAVGSHQLLEQSLQSLSARELLNTGQAEDMAEALGMASERAKELLSWTEQLAIKSPFDQAGVAEAFRTAMAYGFTSEEAQRLTQVTLDFATASGSGTAAMNSIALALGQMAARGKVSMQEIMQLTNAGVPAMQILQDAFGMAGGELEKAFQRGEITAEQAIETIVSTLERDFAGAAERASGGVTGMLNALGDIKEMGLRELFGSAFEALEPLGEELLEWLQGPGLEKIGEWGEKLGEFVAQAVELGMQIPEVIGNIKELFTGEAERPAWLEGIFGAVTQIGDWFAENGPGLRETAGNLFGKLQEVGQDLAANVLPFITEQFQKVADWLDENGPLIQDFAAAVSEAFAFIVGKLAGLWPTIENILGGLIELVLGIATTIMQVATGDWAGAWETIKETASRVWEALKEAFNSFADWVAGWFGTSWAEVKQTWQNNWDMFKEIVSTVWDNIKTTVQEKLESVRTAISGKVEAFKQLGRDLLEGLKAGIIEKVGNIIEAVRSAVDSAIQAGKNALGISSPSRVFMEIGGNLMEGMALGIQNSIRIPQMAVTEAATGVAAAAVIQPAGAARGGGGVQFNFNYAPLISLADEREARTKLLPVLREILYDLGVL